MAPQVDALFYLLLGLSLFFILLIAGLIIYFGIRYREGSKADRSGKIARLNTGQRLQRRNIRPHPGHNGHLLPELAGRNG